jgi:hypothetical protein
MIQGMNGCSSQKDSALNLFTQNLFVTVTWRNDESDIR